MDKKRSAVEALKTLLIVVLTCSALYLVSRSQLFGQLPGVLTARPAGESGTSAGEEQAQAVLPLRMAVMTESGCYGVQYGDGDLTALFQRLAPLLNEALFSADVPLQVTQEQWEQALLSAPGVYFDFQGSIPLQVLSGWLSGRENPGMTASVRHLLLTSGGDGDVFLYYRDEEKGEYFSCRADVVNLAHLQSAAAEVSSNGTSLACESDKYSALAPCTLISPQTPAPREYAASNPLISDETRRLNALLEALSFPPGITSVYSTPEGRRARSGNDTVSISGDGVVSYRSTDGGERYPVPSSQENSPLFSGVEYARQLAHGVLTPWCGEARLYLSSVQTLGEESWQVEFCYALDGAPVQVNQLGYAARIVVSRGHITEFELQLRTYTPLGETTLLLPEAQAAAALAALGKSGSALQLRYQDSGDVVRAGWVTW